MPLSPNQTRDLVRRRRIIVASLLGMTSMAATSLLQFGVVKRLPDPPFRWWGLRFDSKRVNLSREARPFGFRDGPIALGGFALNVPLALWGSADRAHERPWLALLACAKAGLETAAAVVFFSKMPRIEKAWCSYCIVAAAASTAVFALSLPEGRRAGRELAVRSRARRAA